MLKDKYQLHSFKKRRRHWVFIIGAHSSRNVDKAVLEMGNFTNKEKMGALIASLTTDQDKQDFLSMRNACLLYKALKKERIRELDFSICGFDKISKNYKHHCKDSLGKYIIARP